VEEFLRLAGERASQMAQAIESAETWFKKQTGQWESLLREGGDKVTKLNQTVEQGAEQSATQAKTWQDLLQRSNQTLAQFTQAIQANEKRVAQESSAWRAAVMETDEKVARLTQVVENANTSFREGVTTLEQQTRLLVKEHETTNHNLGEASETITKAGNDFHRLVSAVVKKFNEICTNTSASFDRSVQQANATLAAALTAIQESNARLQTTDLERALVDGALDKHKHKHNPDIFLPGDSADETDHGISLNG
jgi:hypothetical protein